MAPKELPSMKRIRMTTPNPQVHLAQAIKTMAKNIPALLELSTLEARVTRHKFMALVREGFTEAQAIELVKKVNP